VTHPTPPRVQEIRLARAQAGIRRIQASGDAAREIDRLRALIDRILSLSDLTAGQQKALRVEAGLLKEDA
jgi:hypothetical protein